MGSFYGYDEPRELPEDPDLVARLQRQLLGWYRPQEAALGSELEFSWYLDPVKPAADGEADPPQSTA